MEGKDEDFARLQVAQAATKFAISVAPPTDQGMK